MLILNFSLLCVHPTSASQINHFVWFCYHNNAESENRGFFRAGIFHESGAKKKTKTGNFSQLEKMFVFV
jgi:hypothetical protein